MNKDSRTKNTLRNLRVGFAVQFIGFIMSFVNRTVFIYLLGSTFLGVNSLFSNILTILSITEAGAESAFTSLLYKPLLNDNEETVASIMKTFRKVFMVIGIIVTIVGIGLTPYLSFFVPDKNRIDNLELIYLMFLTGTVVSYFCTYSISLIKADQKTYIVSIFSQVFVFIQYVVQIIILVLTHNYLLYLAIQIACPILRNFLLTRKAKMLYPLLKRKAKPLPQELKELVVKRIGAGFYTHLGYVIAQGTDSIVITKFLGFEITGIYSNYLMIMNMSSNIISVMFTAVTASVGNLIAENNVEKTRGYFNRFMFMSFVIQSFVCICFVVLFNPFITLWIGETYTMQLMIVILAVVVFFMNSYGFRIPLIIFKNASGLYYNDRHFAFLEGIANIVISVVLVKEIGLAGVFIGTIISSGITLCSSIYVLYKHLLKYSIMNFIRRFVLYIMFMIGLCSSIYYSVNLIPHETWGGFFTMAIVCAIMIICGITIVFFRTEEFKYFVELFGNMILRMIKRTPIHSGVTSVK
jgi:O-antigen/teichoic acid export membrane protein